MREWVWCNYIEICWLQFDQVRWGEQASPPGYPGSRVFPVTWVKFTLKSLPSPVPFSFSSFNLSRLPCPFSFSSFNLLIQPVCYIFSLYVQIYTVIKCTDWLTDWVRTIRLDWLACYPALPCLPDCCTALSYLPTHRLTDWLPCLQCHICSLTPLSAYLYIEVK